MGIAAIAQRTMATISVLPVKHWCWRKQERGERGGTKRNRRRRSSRDEQVGYSRRRSAGRETVTLKF